MDDAKAYWVGFNLVKGIGPTRLRALIEYFGDVRSAWLAPAPALEATGLSSKLVQSLVQTRQSGGLERTWERINKLAIKVLTWDDDDYPRRLKEIDQSPPVLYLSGDLTDEINGR